MNCSVPFEGVPMALSIPSGVSWTRSGELPGRTRSMNVLLTIPPRTERS